MSRREKTLIALLVGLSVGFLGLTVLGRQGLREVRRLRADREQLTSEIEQLRERRRELETEIGALRTNARSVEDRARRELGMIKEGETVFLLPKNNGQRR